MIEDVGRRGFRRADQNVEVTENHVSALVQLPAANEQFHPVGSPQLAPGLVVFQRRFVFDLDVLIEVGFVPASAKIGAQIRVGRTHDGWSSCWWFHRVSSPEGLSGFSRFSHCCACRSRRGTIRPPESCSQEPAAPTSFQQAHSRVGTLWTSFFQSTIDLSSLN